MYMGDYNAQQIPFYVHCHDMVRNGNFLWDFGTELGTDFLSSYTYYTVTSPFFWLTVPFPSSWVPYLMGPLFVLKFSCAALASYAYIKKYTNTQKAAAFGALLYAFSGWSTYNIFYFQFHEPLIIFPLVLLALDKLIEEKKFGFFSLSIATSAILNYYFSVGIIVFVILYWFIRTVSKSWNMTVGKTFWILGEGILGLLMACFVLVPSAAAVFGMSRTGSLLNFKHWFYYESFEMYACIFQSLFLPPDIPAIQSGIYCKPVAWQSLSMYLPLIGPIGVLTFIEKNKKNWMSLLIKVCIVMMFIPVLNTLFTLLQPVYYARWFMMPLLIMSLMSAKSFEDYKVKDHVKPAIAVFLVTVIYSFVIIALNLTGVLSGGILGLFFIFTGLTIFSFILLFITYGNSKNKAPIKARRLLPLMLTVVIFFSSFSILYGFNSAQEGNDMSFIKRVNSDVSELATDNCRVSALTSYNNIFMYSKNIMATDCFHSVVDGNTSLFYESVLGSKRTVTSQVVMNYASYKSLLSVKYFVVDKTELKYYLDYDPKSNHGDKKSNETAKQIQSAYKKHGSALYPGFKSVVDREDYEIFENECYLPFGIPYDSYILQKDYNKLSTEQKNEALLKALIVTDKSDVSDLSEFKASESFSDDDYIKYCKNLKKLCGTNFKGSSSLKLKIETDAPCYILVSIPANDGWNATVNKKPSKILKADGGLIAVRVDAGNNLINLKYHSKPLEFGFKISFGASIVFLLLFVSTKIRNRIKKTDEELDTVFKI